VIRLHLGEWCCLAGMALLGLDACRGARSPEPGDLARYRAAIEVAQTTLIVAGALCTTLPPGERASCHDQLAALDDAVVVGSQVLASVEACQRAADAVCVSQATETARERLPALLRLLGRETAPASSGASP
jgi:hypothetical protein